MRRTTSTWLLPAARPFWTAETMGSRPPLSPAWEMKSIESSPVEPQMTPWPYISVRVTMRVRPTVVKSRASKKARRMTETFSSPRSGSNASMPETIRVSVGLENLPISLSTLASRATSSSAKVPKTERSAPFKAWAVKGTAASSRRWRSQRGAARTSKVCTSQPAPLRRPTSMTSANILVATAGA